MSNTSVRQARLRLVTRLQQEKAELADCLKRAVSIMEAESEACGVYSAHLKLFRNTLAKANA